MRKVVITLAALAAFGIALPAATISTANAETVIIKKGHRDHGHHTAGAMTTTAGAIIAPSAS